LNGNGKRLMMKKRKEQSEKQSEARQE
jgi:hypothetical protein